MRVPKLIAATALAAIVAVPAAAQVALPGVPTVPALPVDTPALPVDTPALPVDPTGIVNLDDLPALLDPASPVLDLVTGTIGDLLAQINGALADTPLANLLSLQGEDAIDAAIAFSQATFDASDVAILARDDVFADALTTGALQGILNAPLLLTSSGDLDSRTARELVRLGVTRLVILGAEDAINPLVAQKLQIAGLDVTRVGGPSRVETATMAAGVGAPGATTAVLTRAYSSTGDDSQAFADLLAVSPWAAENGWPVLLTQTGSLTPSVADYLGDSAITDVIIVGGEQAISPAVQQAVEGLGISTRRVSGTNRFATAVAVAGERGFTSSADPDRLILAEGTSSRSDIWAPGFAAAAHGASHAAPILLTAGEEIPTETLEFIVAGLEQNILDGGPATICASFVSPVACQAAGLLMLGDLGQALQLLDLPLAELPGLATVLSLIEQVTGLDLGAILDTIPGALTDPVGAVEGAVGGVTDAVGGAVGGATDAVTGAVGGATGGTTGGTTGAVGGAVGGATGAVGGATGAVTGATGGLLGG